MCICLNLFIQEHKLLLCMHHTHDYFLYTDTSWLPCVLKMLPDPLERALPKVGLV